MLNYRSDNIDLKAIYLAHVYYLIINFKANKIFIS